MGPKCAEKGRNLNSLKLGRANIFGGEIYHESHTKMWWAKKVLDSPKGEWMEGVKSAKCRMTMAKTLKLKF